MPIRFDYSRRDLSDCWSEARRQVRAKFPSIVEGSAGWHRAVQGRFDRLRKVFSP